MILFISPLFCFIMSKEIEDNIMKQIVMNEKLELSYPENVHVMSDAEKAELQFIRNGEGYCLSDPETHILISLGWEKLKGFQNLMLSAKDLASYGEKAVAEAMKQYGYVSCANEQTEIAGVKAGMYSYRYVVKDVPMYGESCVLKKDGTAYYLHLYTRTEYREENVKVWKDILRSANWK